MILKVGRNWNNVYSLKNPIRTHFTNTCFCSGVLHWMPMGTQCKALLCSSVHHNHDNGPLNYKCPTKKSDHMRPTYIPSRPLLKHVSHFAGLGLNIYGGRRLSRARVKLRSRQQGPSNYRHNWPFTLYMHVKTPSVHSQHLKGEPPFHWQLVVELTNQKGGPGPWTRNSIGSLNGRWTDVIVGPTILELL